MAGSGVADDEGSGRWSRLIPTSLVRRHVLRRDGAPRTSCPSASTGVPIKV